MFAAREEESKRQRQRDITEKRRDAGDEARSWRS